MNISSNWTVSVGDTLENVVTTSSKNENEIIADLKIENFVCLTKDTNDNGNIKPELEIRPGEIMKQIDIVSEGILIEVFGKDNEYLLTCKSNFIDDWEGIAVYCAKIVLPDLPVCKLKFSRIKHQSRLWLYCIQLTVDKYKSLDVPQQTLFNMENVQKLLNSSNLQISERAEKFKTLFESCNSTPRIQEFNQVPNMENYLNFLRCDSSFQNYLRTKSVALEQPNRENEISKEVDKTHRILPFDKLDLTDGVYNSVDNNSPKSLQTSDMKMLTNYINQKFSDIEENLLKHIDNKFNELKIENNSNFERMFKILDTLKTDKM